VNFLEQIRKYPQANVLQTITESDPAQIDSILCRQQISIDDFACLLNPAITVDQLERLAVRAQQITRQRFGRTILLYAPLYLSNECLNGCRYCGFNAENDLHRKTLSLTEIEREARFLHAQGFRHMLLLTGEAPQSADVTYLEQAVKEAKAVLATELPPGAAVVARFCLAKKALRGGDADPEAMLRDFIAGNGARRRGGTGDRSQRGNSVPGISPTTPESQR